MFEILEAFIKYIQFDEGRSKNTCLSYERDLRQFIEWTESNLGISRAADVSESGIMAFVSHLKDEGKSAATISRSIASIKAFFAYSAAKSLIISDPAADVHPPKVIKKAPKIASSIDVEKLLRQPDDSTPKGLRDRAMLSLMYDTGMRVSELIGLDTDDIDLKRRTADIRTSRPRTVPFGRKTARLMSRYLKEVREELLQDSDTDAFFVNCTDGTAMTRQGFWKVIKKYGRDAGIGTEITPHMLRHSFAAHAIRNGEDLKKVQSILGHSDASTTSEYAEL